MHFTDRCAPARRVPKADTIAAFTPTEWLRALMLTYPERLVPVMDADPDGRVTGSCGADGVLRIRLYPTNERT